MTRRSKQEVDIATARVLSRRARRIVDARERMELTCAFFKRALFAGILEISDRDEDATIGRSGHPIVVPCRALGLLTQETRRIKMRPGIVLSAMES
jgi:hypothetical protein